MLQQFSAISFLYKFEVSMKEKKLSAHVTNFEKKHYQDLQLYTSRHL